MDVTNFIFNILILIGIILLLYFKFFIPSYLKEKGKNLATKEDIKEITKLVEDIKHSNNSSIEKLKTEMSIISKNYFVKIDSERESIIDFLSKLSSYIEYRTTASNLFLIKTDKVFFEEILKVNFQEYSMIRVSHSKFALFCENNELLDLSTKLMIELSEVYSNIISIHKKTSNILEAREKYIETTQNDKNTISNEIINRLNTMMDENIDSLIHLKNFDNLYNLFYEFLIKCKKYLNEEKSLKLI